MVDNILERLRAEYIEMPGLQLTVGQVERLCGIDSLTCRVVLDALLDEGFLCVTVTGRYARVTEGALGLRPRSPKTGLRFNTQSRKAS